MNVLVIAPHPDDESIGCGGAIRLHVSRADRVSIAFLTSGELGLKHLAPERAWLMRESEAVAAAAVLGVPAESLAFLRQPDWFVGENVAAAAAALAALLRRRQPGIIYLPHPLEWHPDHRAALRVVRAALWDSALPDGARREEGRRAPELRGYEVWTPMPTYDWAEDISREMPCKLRAIRQYRSQLEYIRYDRAVRGLNQYRGHIAARCRYAEVFLSMDPDGANFENPVNRGNCSGSSTSPEPKAPPV